MVDIPGWSGPPDRRIARRGVSRSSTAEALGVSKKGRGTGSMARTLRSDKGLFLAVLFLVCVSAVMVSSASAAAALQNNWHIIRYLFKQSTWVVAGFLLMAVT